jgi:hypothetical protein
MCMKYVLLSEIYKRVKDISFQFLSHIQCVSKWLRQLQFAIFDETNQLQQWNNLRRVQKRFKFWMKETEREALKWKLLQKDNNKQRPCSYLSVIILAINFWLEKYSAQIHKKFLYGDYDKSVILGY